MTPILVLSDVSKRFEENGVLAVDRVSLQVERGEVAAIIGENGAGKSTLMHIVAGTVPRDSGTLAVDGVPIEPRHHGAADHGIVMSFQQPRLDPDLSVLENLFLGAEPRRYGVFFDRKSARRKVFQAAPDFSPELLSRRLGSLSSGQLRIVSLVGALLRLPADRSGILILDEPTEATTPREAERVFEIIRSSAARGHAVIMITHKLAEVSRIADRAFLMRGGRIEHTFRSPIETEALARELGGSEQSVWTPEPESGAVSAADVLILDQVSVEERGHLRLKDVSLRVRRGEIVGCIGVRQNGIEALEDVIAGWQIPTQGRMAIAEHWCRHKLIDRRIGELRHAGLGYVPSARFRRGSSLNTTLQDNLIARARNCLHKSGFFVKPWIGRFTTEATDRFEITGTGSEPLYHLSGGNIQKSILAREITTDSPLLLVCEPGWGLDIATRTRLKRELQHAASGGSGIMVLSTDVDEVLDFCDRILVFSDGSITADLSAQNTSRAEIARLLGSAFMSSSEQGVPREASGAYG
jgi:simple sugar transport system ATP-binding protein